MTIELAEEDRPIKVVVGMNTFYAWDVEEAWKIIGGQPFGLPHICYDKYGIMEEFIPF